MFKKRASGTGRKIRQRDGGDDDTAEPPAVTDSPIPVSSTPMTPEHSDAPEPAHISRRSVRRPTGRVSAVLQATSQQPLSQQTASSSSLPADLFVVDVAPVRAVSAEPMDVDAPPPVEPYNPFANRMKSSSGPGGASTRSDGRTLTERVPPATAPAADYISLDGAELYSRGGSRTSSRAFPSMSNLSVIDDDEANNSVLFADDGGANMGPIDGRDGSGDLSDDQSDDDNDEERDREEAELREHELEIIRRGGGMAGRTSLAAKAKRAVRAIEREADLRLPEIPTIQSFPTALASATSQLAKEREWLDSHAAQMAAAAAELEKLELADVDADADLLELATLHAQAESLRNDVQDMLEMAADMGPTLSTWEADWDALAASEVGANQLVTVQQERVRGAFDELRVDLAHLPTVLARFAGYRASDRDGYRRSLAAEVIPVVVAPHVRADLLSWDPLSPAVPAQPIEERVWHAAVVAYGSGDVRVQNPNDPDVAIVRHVTVDYVVPALMSRIRAVPPSAWSGVPAVRRKWQDLLEEVLYVVDKSDEAFQRLAVVSALACMTALESSSATAAIFEHTARIARYLIPTTPDPRPDGDDLAVVILARAAFQALARTLATPSTSQEEHESLVGTAVMAIEGRWMTGAIAAKAGALDGDRAAIAMALADHAEWRVGVDQQISVANWLRARGFAKEAAKMELRQ